MQPLSTPDHHSFANVDLIDLQDTQQFPQLLLDYLAQKPILSKFYEDFPNLENATETIHRRKNFDSDKRNTLVATLKLQYSDLPNLPDFEVLLSPNTFTVTTGHQLNIFTGPLYIIYKIVTTINLANDLKKQYPDYNFVPVYWMATEDHDFAEIASFNYMGNKFTWPGNHTGAVGRLNPKELAEILKVLPEEPDLFNKAYLGSDTLTDAVRCYMHELFGNKGLICLDADDANLKRFFLPVIQEELLKNSAADLVKETTNHLNALGYKTPLSAREINFFYLEGNVRERIIRNGDNFEVINTALSFTESEFIELTNTHPERFSPNVVLRPLYEEVILPNLAYIGGPSEVPYWLQLKGIFDHYQVPFPMLIPRNFAMYLNKNQTKKIQKLNLALSDLFLDEVSLRKKFVKKATNKSLDLKQETKLLEKLFYGILEKAQAIDITLQGTVEAALTRQKNAFEKLEKRLLKAEERNHQSEIEQLLYLKNKLFPKGTAQERYDNLLNFYMKDPDFIKKLFAALDPLNFKYYMLSE